jgi:aminopeptidase N
MRTDAAVPVRLEDYRPSSFLIDKVSLTITLHPATTKIQSLLHIRPNPVTEIVNTLTLDGDDTQFVSLRINGVTPNQDAFTVSPQTLTVHRVPEGAFTLAIETQVNPEGNTQLSGLYRSNGVYCTQCEAQGFRRITYFLDRPDILSAYETRIEADRIEAPILLGNGNLIEAGDLPQGRHYTLWYDPHLKPCYLFALVGGKLDCLEDTFTTLSGKEVKLGIYVEPGKVGRTSYAMDALKRSMRWEEEVFGREYDLEVFNIVAVSDFNMGAMENKGLNIFNDKYILADPYTATDTDYAAIESIIAHEYFHNWTGNRITCRDWFQLCLKEGLTVFRDQEFSSDMRSRAVHRISEVRNLRIRQFAEDAGPLAHPVRPRAYHAIDNFYTATVYDKGAELIRMLKTLLGEQIFAQGMDLYFTRCDGMAATVEDFLACFVDISGKDLSHFALWYEQAGTPQVLANGHFDAKSQTYRLDLAQSIAAAPGHDENEPVPIPIRLSLVSEGGEILEYSCPDLRSDGVFVLEKAAASLIFSGIKQKPVPSLFRNFSAPVRLLLSLSEADDITLLRHDSDPFNRWQAGQRAMLRLVLKAYRGEAYETEHLARALQHYLDSQGEKDPAFAALVLSLPSEGEIAQEIGSDVDPSRVLDSRRAIKASLMGQIFDTLCQLYDAMTVVGPYRPDAQQAGKRALRQACLDGLACADLKKAIPLVLAQEETATSLTEYLGALTSLAAYPCPVRETLLARFETRYANESLVLDKWFAIQSSFADDDVLERITRLTKHPAFSWTNPNRLRSVVTSFAMNNLAQFHRVDGKGYAFVRDVILHTDPLNPQLAARLLTAFSAWRIFEPSRREAAKNTLHHIADITALSADARDIVHRTLGGE